MRAPQPALEPLSLRLLRLAACTILAGRGWLYLSGMGPLSTFFWHQDWLERPLEKFFSLPWVDYTAHSEAFILRLQSGIGLVLLAGAIAAWRAGRARPVSNGILWACTLLLLPYWLLRWVDANYQLPMLLEHFLQWGTPLLLLFAHRIQADTFRTVASVFVAATFIGHGLYALGWPHPQPADYRFMIEQTIGLNEASAKTFLHGIGAIDIALALCVFVARIQKPFLYWAAFWGIATALARAWAHFTPAENFYGMHPWAAEAILRLTHGLIPLVLLLSLREASKPDEQESTQCRKGNHTEQRKHRDD